MYVCCVLLKGIDKKVGSSTSSTLVLLILFFFNYNDKIKLQKIIILLDNKVECLLCNIFVLDL